MKPKKAQHLERSRLVCGVGINDADYVVMRSETVDGRQKVIWECPFYRVWRHMLERCYSESYHKRWPSYVGCEVCLEWHRLSAFRVWMDTQDWKEKQLDKDILVPGNKVYSPSSCIFVSCQLNNFLTDNAKSRGAFPIGASWNAKRGMFQATCANPFTGKREYLGCFSDPETAHAVWRGRKHDLACQHADLQIDPRLNEALRARFANYESEEAAA